MDNKYIKFLEQFDVEKQVNYIRKIRFPHYKNLVTDTEIHFDKPFTVLVGPNGSGKSSVLHAIYGCPLDKSLGDYWFSTALDPIDEGKGITNRFIYEFKPKDYPEFVEVCKSRVKRSKSDTKNANMDNWETTKPMKMHGMKRMPPYRSKHKEIRSLERWSPVIKDVEYIDFRSDLSAFDKFFYFGFYREGKKIKSKQDFLRSRSSNLKNHIENDDGEDLIWRRKAQKDSALDKVTDMELQWINLILGKSYTGAKIIKHALFNNAGYSIQFTCEDKKYSEAAAGSGEVSVVNCVTRVMRAKKGSLVLLDEPEVSLHPGAQSELRDFLLAMIQQKQHQVVISTHSEQFVKGLPATCIKLFVEDKKDKRFHIIHECSSDQAFLRIGGTKDAKRKVYVEDKTAKLIVEAALTELDEMYNVKYSVIVHPGGASAILTNQLPYLLFNEDSEDLILLDGDQRPDDLIDPEDIPPSRDAELDRIIEEQVGISTKSFRLPFNSGESLVKKNELKRKLLKTHWLKVHYMEFDIPEELIWNIVAEDSKAMIDFKRIKKKYNEGDFKERFEEFTNAEFGSSISSEVLQAEKLFLNHRNRDATEWKNFKSMLSDILSIKDLSV